MPARGLARQAERRAQPERRAAAAAVNRIEVGIAEHERAALDLG
jgi:hypothetical protein